MRIDRGGGQAEPLKVRPIPDDHSSIERQPRLAAVPGYKPVDGERVAATRVNGGECIENSGFRLFQFRDGQGLAAKARLSMLLRNHRERLLSAALTVFSSMMPSACTPQSRVIEANVPLSFTTWVGKPATGFWVSCRRWRPFAERRAKPACCGG